MAAFFTFYISATVWPKMRNYQNYENEGFSLKWAVKMPQTKKSLKSIYPQKNKIIFSLLWSRANGHHYYSVNVINYFIEVLIVSHFRPNSDRKIKI